MTTTTPVLVAELAYLGGFFDGEGSVGLYYNKLKRGWQPIITVSQNYSRFAEKIFDGWAKQYHANVCYEAAVRKRVLRVQIRSERGLRAFITAVMPYTKLKKRQLAVLDSWLSGKQYSYRTSQILKALKRMEE